MLSLPPPGNQYLTRYRYLSEKTTIPIPRLHGYSIHVDNILGLPFMLLEYIEGDTLFGIKISELELSKKEHLYSQLADVYIQLHRQQFDWVGALTLDENDKDWVFAHNRPLTVDINEQEVSGRDICRYLPPERTFGSTIDYVYMLTKVISNDFYRCPDSVLDKEDARFYLYGNFSSLAVLMEWVDPDLNHGPFVLMHGDLRPPNIVIDKDFNIVSILDWEFSHTIPIQMFVPPYWLTNEDVLEISRSAISSLLYKIEAFNFRRKVFHREYKYYNPQKKSIDDLPLYGRWKDLRDMTSFLLPHGLLKPHYFSNIYWNVLDHVYYGGDRKKRVDTFYSLELRKPELTAVDTKMREFEEFEKRREELGIEQGHVLQPVTKEEVAEISRKIQEYRQSQEQTNADITGDNPQSHLMWRYFSRWICRLQLAIPEIKGRRLGLQWVVGIGAIITAYLAHWKWRKSLTSLCSDKR